MKALRAERAFRASYYRFVHTSGSLANSPEMLGAARPESEGFSAQAHMGQRQLSAPTQPSGADV